MKIQANARINGQSLATVAKFCSTHQIEYSSRSQLVSMAIDLASRACAKAGITPPEQEETKEILKAIGFSFKIKVEPPTLPNIKPEDLTKEPKVREKALKDIRDMLQEK